MWDKLYVGACQICWYEEVGYDVRLEICFYCYTEANYKMYIELGANR